MLMPKRIYLARRHPGLSPDEFRARWREHGALAMSMPGWQHLARYVQCDTIRDALPGAADPYDGVAMMWFWSPEARRQHRAETPSRMAMESDEDSVFAERVNNFAIITEEHVIAPGPLAPIRAVRFLRKRAGLSTDAFRAAWGDQHAARVLGVARPPLRYVQNVPLPPEVGPVWGLDYDGIEEFWFGGLDEARAYFAQSVPELAQPGQDGLTQEIVLTVVTETVLHDATGR
jgi:hypothetical protein